MNKVRILAVALGFVVGFEFGQPAESRKVAAQRFADSTRFNITGAPILSLPRGEFGHNIGNQFGATGGVAYHVDRPGFVSLRFDVSGYQYGSEKNRSTLHPFGGRLSFDVRTTNTLAAIGGGPELAWPRGRVRPYANAGISKQFFRTSSYVEGVDSEAFASTTNHKDSVAAWVFGGGVRVPLVMNDPRKAISLDLGVRYSRGGVASYLREDSIQDLPDGSLAINPFITRTPQVVYLIGLRYRIPHNPATPCARLLC
jgi:hypothetical protein